MENLYQEWTVEQDRQLWDERQQPPVVLASRLGRGIRGVQARLSKLQDVNSPAYQRLFGGGAGVNSKRGHNPGGRAVDDDDDDDDEEDDGSGGTNSNGRKSKNKLIPVSQVLRRIEYDYSLNPSDFFVLRYDRLDDTVVKSPLDAPNVSISNKETKLIKALPEHRIVGIMYKERLVWDRSTKLDLVFGGEDGGIMNIVATYDGWKADRDRMLQYQQERREYVSTRLSAVLGVELYGHLDQMTNDLRRAHDDPTISTKQQVETYVQQALKLFQTKRQQEVSQQSNTLESTFTPKSDCLALEELSEFVACWTYDNSSLQELVLSEISIAMDKAERKSTQSIKEKKNATKQPIEMREEDLEETFVRGSGPGGQKINKTSNKVVLIHRPTQLRVECQDTRSLQQNRKIARTRLKDKLDEYINGSQSKLQLKRDKLARKRKQVQAKNRARQIKKHQAKMEKQQQHNDSSFQKLEEEFDF
jgi:uncharacterized protein (UPF0248 family)